MYISKADLELLLEIESYLWNKEKPLGLYFKLHDVNERLINDRERLNKKTKDRIAKKRENNKMYARSNKEIMAYQNAQKRREERGI